MGSTLAWPFRPAAAGRPRRILSIDGGGIRGLIPIEVLAELERQLAERSGRPDAVLADHFDLVAGTSAGALVAAAISIGRPMVQTRQFVVENAGRMFKAAAWRKRLWHLYDEGEFEARIKAFLARLGTRGVLKPLSGAGGEGIFALDPSDPNLNAIIETVTRGGRQLAMVQRYLPEVVEGDKRVLLLDGEPLGAILRVPQGGDLRSNIHAGGRVVAAEIDDADRRIIAAVAPRLRADGLIFVGLDVIGGKLTEVNVTSPTGIQQMARLMNENVPGRVIDWLEARV